MKRVVVSVTNDLVTDQRVHKVCTALEEMGCEVLLVGRVLKNSLPIERKYKTRRFRLLFTKSALFYAEYNIRLFFFLMFVKADIFLSNDLDTLTANYFASVLRRKKLVYDSHEYYTGTPELMHAHFNRNVWKFFERLIFPRLKHIYTVNQSIADMYSKEYKKDNIKIIRNIAPRFTFEKKATRSEFGMPEDKKIIILQGSGINVQRGAEEAVLAMKYIEGAVLYIIGNGDVFELLKQMRLEQGLENKITILGRMPYAQLMQFTMNADLGLSLDKGISLNYRFSLPNKIFDYIQAGIPILASDLPEVARIVKGYNVGETIDSHDPEQIALKIKDIVFDSSKSEMYKHNASGVAKELCWEEEVKKLKEIYKPIIS